MSLSAEALKSETTESTESVLHDVWVQCDEVSCHKWRRITASYHASLDQHAAWFCHMNPDQHYSRCDIPEENSEQDEIKADLCRMRYVTSAMQPGTLVWAKMSGYCRWPGVISPCVDTGLAYVLHIDGQALSYHVEFLGESHSHTWLSAFNVELFSVGKDECTKKPSSGWRGGRKRRGPWRWASQAAHNIHVKEKRRYRGSTVECAVEEATEWSKLLPEQRLKHLVFTHHNTELKEASEHTSHQMSSNASATKQSTSAMSLRQRTQPGPDDSPLSQTRKPLHRVRTSTVRRRVVKHSSPERAAAATTPESCRQEDHSHRAELDGLGHPGARWVRGKEHLDRALLHSAPLRGHSKEEKLSLDITSYVNNQASFTRDLAAFTARHGLPPTRAPVWHRVTVQPYDVFLAVYEHGGYHAACKKRVWAQIYRDFTGMNVARNGGSALKRFYERSLLPYESYICGREFQQQLPYVTTNKETPCDQSAEPAEDISLCEGRVSSADSHFSPSSIGVPQHDDTSECSVDVAGLFDAMEDLHKQCTMLNDENEPDDRIHVVPEVTAFDQSSTSSEDGSRVLYEMQALQQEMYSLQ